MQPPNRKVKSIGNRTFAVDLPTETLEKIHRGTLKTRYKGLRFCKNPFDISLYLRLLERLRPNTIIEIGASEGGSAMWLGDQCRAFGIEADIYSLDVNPPSVLADGVTFLRGDSLRPAETFPTQLFRQAAHPWLLIEDSAHTFDSVSAVLQYFDPLLVSGDYAVVEDGVVADLPGEHYRTYEDGPNRAVAAFLEDKGERYFIDETQCDFYGHNVTYCPNAWLVKA